MSDTTTNNASTTKTVNKELTQNNDEVSLPELFLRVFFFSSCNALGLNVRLDFKTGEEDYRWDGEQEWKDFFNDRDEGGGEEDLHEGMFTFFFNFESIEGPKSLAS